MVKQNLVATRKFLRSRGIAPDTVDIKAQWDTSLTRSENYRLLERKYKKKDYSRRNINNQTMRYLTGVHNNRSIHSQITDEKRKAKKRFKNPTERQIGLWLKRPNRYDIIGID